MVDFFGIDKIKDVILNLFKGEEELDPKQINDYFQPLSNNIDNIFVKDNILSVIDIIVRDRNGNNVFDLEDLHHLTHDFTGVMALVKAILLVIGTIADFNLKYHQGETEELIFKMLTYVFLVVVPLASGHIWTEKEKEDVINVAFSMYQLVVSSQQVKQLMENVSSLLKGGTCICAACASKEEIQEARIQKYLPMLCIQLSASMENARTQTKLHRKVAKLKEKIKLLEKK